MPAFWANCARAKEAQGDMVADDIANLDDRVLAGEVEPYAARVVILSTSRFVRRARMRERANINRRRTVHFAPTLVAAGTLLGLSPRVSLAGGTDPLGVLDAEGWCEVSAHMDYMAAFSKLWGLKGSPTGDPTRDEEHLKRSFSIDRTHRRPPLGGNLLSQGCRLRETGGGQ